MNRNNEALIWLSIGNAYRAALDLTSALDAFQRAQALAPSDTTAYSEASAAEAAAIAAQDDPVEAELRELQGKWVPVSLEADGKRLEGAKDDATVSIRFSRWIDKSATGESASTLKIDPTKEPKQIDVLRKVGNDVTVPFPGIYTLEGDTLKVSLAFPFEGNLDAIQKRPGEFTTRPGDDFVVTV